MRETLVVLAVIYGVILGIYTALNLGKRAKIKNKDKEVLLEETEISLEAIVGKNIDSQKKVVFRLIWFFFLIYFLFSVFSLILLWNHFWGMLIAGSLIIIELIEQTAHIIVLKKAKSFKEFSKTDKLGRITSYIHLIGIPILIGMLL